MKLTRILSDISYSSLPHSLISSNLEKIRAKGSNRLRSLDTPVGDVVLKDRLSLVFFSRASIVLKHTCIRPGNAV